MARKTPTPKPTPKPKPTLPAEPLLEALQRLCGGNVGTNRLAARAGVPPRTILRWRDEGERPRLETADRVLCNSGLCWWEVWPDHPFAISYFGDGEPVVLADAA